MAHPIDEITIHYEEDNVVKVKELKKEILTRGVWSTIMFLYQDFVPSQNAYGPQKISIRRYKKVGDRYLPQSKFNISGAGQAKKVSDQILAWLPEMGQDTAE